MDIKGRHFLVTGGSSGLGAGCVNSLAARGANVLIADLQPPAQITEGAVFRETDICDPQAVQAAIDQLDRLNGVICCAGIIGGERICGREGPASLEAFRKVVEVNLVGTFNVLRLAAASMQKNEPGDDGERGVVICTASVAAYEGQIGQAAYAASKGGVVSLVLPSARELAKFGIRVCCIAPGVFETPMMGQVPDAFRESLEAQIPFPSRFGTPQEFANLAGQIIENRMLNGCVIRLDGGIRMTPK